MALRCEHLQANERAPQPSTSDGCEDCIAEGKSDWSHLRLCMQCGHIGCCDSSPSQHATVHFHDTSHPVIRSFEPGEQWRWCFVDEVMG